MYICMYVYKILRPLSAIVYQRIRWVSKFNFNYAIYCCSWRKSGNPDKQQLAPSAFICVCTDASGYVYKYVHTHIHTYIHTCVCTCLLGPSNQLLTNCCATFSYSFYIKNSKYVTLKLWTHGMQLGAYRHLVSFLYHNCPLRLFFIWQFWNKLALLNIYFMFLVYAFNASWVDR